MWDCTPCRPYSLTINFLAVKMMKDSHVFITCSYIPKIALKFVYTYILAGNQHTIITWIPFWFHLLVWWKKSLLSYQLSMHKVFNALNVKKSVRILHHIKITVSFYVIKGCTIHSNHLWYYLIIMRQSFAVLFVEYMYYFGLLPQVWLVQTIQGQDEWAGSEEDRGYEIKYRLRSQNEKERGMP